MTYYKMEVDCNKTIIIYKINDNKNCVNIIIIIIIIDY